MTIKVSKPEFNLRSKLNELGGIVSPDKMPTGSTIQTQRFQTTTQATSNNSTSYVSVIGQILYILHSIIHHLIIKQKEE